MIADLGSKFKREEEAAVRVHLSAAINVGQHVVVVPAFDCNKSSNMGSFVADFFNQYSK